MRIDELLRDADNGTITEAKYERIKPKGIFPTVKCDKENGWDASRLDELSEDEARERLEAHWQMKDYEQVHGLKHAIRGFSIQVTLDHPDEPRPEWPEELQEYDTDLFPEAYLCNKFNINPPN